jgi:hypothetical protein
MTEMQWVPENQPLSSTINSEDIATAASTMNDEKNPLMWRKERTKGQKKIDSP